MADNTTTVVDQATQDAAAAKYKRDQMIKKIFIGSVVVLVLWFAYKSFKG